MAFLFIGSTGDQAGHSLVTWAVARRLLEKGYSVGFFKPFGTCPVNLKGKGTDQDALLFKEVLNLSDPLERICPYLLSEEGWGQSETAQIMEDCKALSRELSRGKDVLIIMGTRHIFFDDPTGPIPDISLATELNADFLLVHRFRKASSSAYSILLARSLLRDGMKGVILNRVQPERLQEIRDHFLSSLSGKGVRILAAIPEDPVLSFKSLREIVDVLKGEVLWSGGRLDRPVGRMTVGSSVLKRRSMLFKRVYNKIIFLEPSPSERGVEEAFWEPSIAGILLTGGIHPAPQILQAAKEDDIPLLLVQEDTFAALERLEKSPPRLSPRDEAKVSYFTELMDRDGALDKLLHLLGPVSP